MSLNVTREPHIITATIDRPAAMNAINFEVMDHLESLLNDLEADPGLRLFVLTGTGKSFISGGDLREFHRIKHANEARKMTARMIAILRRIELLPFWTLAAVNGHTYGGGWEVLLAFDFRIAVSTAVFGFTQGKFYLPPGWGGIPKLKETAGTAQALFWLASQAEITATEACRSGLIQKTWNPSDYPGQLKKLKTALTLNDRPFIEYLKNESLPSETDPFSLFWESEEHQNRVRTFLSERKEK